MSSFSRQNTAGSTGDPAFENVGTKPGLEVFRIKKFQLERLPQTELGYFYSGDCYIVLSTKNNGRWDIHFWLGKHSTIDEQGTAAIKSVELDEFLGGGPVQHREVEGYESPLFLSYFKTGIKYLKGGHEGGFRKISEQSKSEKRLFCVKGRRNVRCKQVKFSIDSLNLGDVFILDNMSDIYVWCPPESGGTEKNKGIQIANEIRDHDHCGRGNVHVLDQSWDNHEKFWSLLGGKGPVKPASMGGADDEQFTVEKPQIALFRVSDASGKMVINKVKEGELSFDMLDPSDCFILDAANSGIFVWVGKKGTSDERKRSLEWATEYIKANEKPLWTPVTRILQGSEPSVFLQWFKGAQESQKKRFKPRLYQCSDNSGKLVVQEICNFGQEELAGDDVMILDTGETIFVWIGKDANEKEKKHAKNMAKKYLDESAVPRTFAATIRSINQGQEPEEFIKNFGTWKRV